MGNIKNLGGTKNGEINNEFLKVPKLKFKFDDLSPIRKDVDNRFLIKLPKNKFKFDDLLSPISRKEDNNGFLKVPEADSNQLLTSTATSPRSMDSSPPRSMDLSFKSPRVNYETSSEEEFPIQRNDTLNNSQEMIQKKERKYGFLKVTKEKLKFFDPSSPLKKKANGNGSLKVPEQNFNPWLTGSFSDLTSMDSSFKSPRGKYEIIFDKEPSPKKSYETNEEILAICLNYKKVKHYLKQFIPLTYLILYNTLKLNLDEKEKKLFSKLLSLDQKFVLNFEFEPLIYLYFRSELLKTFVLPKLITNLTLRLITMRLFPLLSKVIYLKFHDDRGQTIGINLDGISIHKLKAKENQNYGVRQRNLHSNFEHKLYGHEELLFVFKNSNELELWKQEGFNSEKVFAEKKNNVKLNFEIQLKDFHVYCYNPFNASFIPFFLEKINFDPTKSRVNNVQNFNRLQSVKTIIQKQAKCLIL